MTGLQDALVPPHSNEAEQAVIGALLHDNNAIDRVGILTAKHFYQEEHRAIYGEIVQSISQGRRADVVTVWERLQSSGAAFVGGLLSYLNQIVQNTPGASNVGRYAEIVVDRALLRGLLLTTAKARDLAQNPQGKTADQVLDAVQSMVTGLAERRTKNEPRMLSEMLSEFVDVLDKRADGLDNAISTGMPSLDGMMNGGVRGGQLVIIAGRPSMGKTALVSHIGLNMASSHSVLMFSMEMSGQEIAGRAVSDRGRVPLSKLLGRINPDDKATWDGLTHGCAQISPIRFAIDETSAVTLLELRMKAKAWKRKHGLDVIIVDYLGLMTGGDGEKRHEQIGFYSRGLKALAKELDVAVIALAQLNRKSEERPDRRPILSDLRDSGEIEQDADAVIFVHRPEMHDPTNPDLKGYAEALIRKQRNGGLGDLPLHFDGAICRFSDWSGPSPGVGRAKQTRRGLD